MTATATAAPPLVIRGMGGLGDNIYQRPFVRAQAEVRGDVWLKTPWPQLYRDLPAVRPVPLECNLRTQDENMARVSDEVWHRPPMRAERMKVWYGLKEPSDTVLGEIESRVPLEGRPFVFDLPDFGAPPVKPRSRPLAVLRPVVLRTEWPNPARNPRPDYLVEATRALNALGFYTVSVADIDGPKEVYVDGPLPAGRHFDEGELTVSELLALIQGADLCVGGPGFLVPAAIAADTPLVMIGGGLGGHNAPEKIMEERMGLERVRTLLPDPYCRCQNRKHRCPKRIPDFRDRFEAAVEAVA